MTLPGLPKRSLDISVETETPESFCCECETRFDRASGPATPSPGDLTLCIRCGSLNVFADDLTARRPTDEEYFAAAADSELQELRRAILAVGDAMKSAESAK
jgi:hypothetical protein